MVILCLQFFHGDREIAMKLARLLADIEPTKRTDCKFMFSARFDTEHDYETIEYVKQKFDVVVHTTKRTGTGHPHGCNDLMADSYQFLIENTRNGNIKDIDAVMLMESDCVPTRRDWLDQVLSEWKTCGKMVLGAWLEIDVCGVRHINGNCIISLDFWRKHRQFLNPLGGGWDSDFGSIMCEDGRASKTIYSDYFYGTDRNPFVGCQRFFEEKVYWNEGHPIRGERFTPSWYHGAKGMTGLNCVKPVLLEGKEIPK